MYTMYVHVCIVMNINYYRGKKIESKWEMETWDGRFRAMPQCKYKSKGEKKRGGDGGTE